MGATWEQHSGMRQSPGWGVKHRCNPPQGLCGQFRIRTLRGKVRVQGWMLSGGRWRWAAFLGLPEFTSEDEARLWMHQQNRTAWAHNPQTEWMMA